MGLLCSTSPSAQLGMLGGVWSLNHGGSRVSGIWAGDGSTGLGEMEHGGGNPHCSLTAGHPAPEALPGLCRISGTSPGLG